MPDLGKTFFQGERDLTLKEISQLEAPNINDGVNVTLVKFGWDSKLLIGGIHLELSPDNRHVARSGFFLRGPLTEDGITIQAARCWPNVEDDVVLHLKLPPSDAFSFSGGGVFSDYLDSSFCNFSFHSVDEDGSQTDVDEGDWEECGVGPFCVRIIAYPAKAAKPKSGLVIKVNVLLFPKTSKDLDDICDATQSPSWPGSRILEAEGQLCPTTANGTWGCPLLPVIIAGADLTSVQNVPPGRELRHAIGCTMRHAARPEAHIKAATLKAHWAKIIGDPTSLVSRPPETTWPRTARAEPTPGKYNQIVYPSFLLFSYNSPEVSARSRRENSGNNPHVVGGFCFL